MYSETPRNPNSTYTQLNNIMPHQLPQPNNSPPRHLRHQAQQAPLHKEQLQNHAAQSYNRHTPKPNTLARTVHSRPTPRPPTPSTPCTNKSALTPSPVDIGGSAHRPPQRYARHPQSGSKLSLDNGIDDVGPYRYTDIALMYVVDRMLAAAWRTDAGVGQRPPTVSGQEPSTCAERRDRDYFVRLAAPAVTCARRLELSCR